MSTDPPATPPDDPDTPHIEHPIALPEPAKERPLDAEDVMYINTVERETNEAAQQIAAQDQQQVAAANDAVTASQESHTEVVAAHAEAVHDNNADVRAAVAALQSGKPLQDGEMVDPTLPDTLPTANMDIPAVDSNALNTAPPTT